ISIPRAARSARMVCSQLSDERQALKLPAAQRSLVVVNDLRDDGEGDFNYFAVGALDLDAGARERLRLLEAVDDAAHARARLCDDLDVVLPIERLEGREGFGRFHFCSPSRVICER